MADNLQFSFDYTAQGATAEAQINNGGTRCLVSVRKDMWVVTQVKDCPQEPHDDDDERANVPIYWFIHAVEEALRYGPGQLNADLFGTDSHLHAQTAAFLLDHAYAMGFHLDDDGCDKVWLSVDAFAADLGAFAKNILTKNVDVAPITLYDEDVVVVDNPAFPVNGLNFLNTL